MVYCELVNFKVVAWLVQTENESETENMAYGMSGYVEERYYKTRYFKL